MQLLVFEEPNIEIYQGVKGDIDRREAEVNTTLNKPINLDIGLFKDQLLINYFSMSSVSLILSKLSCFPQYDCKSLFYLSIYLFIYFCLFFIYFFIYLFIYFIFGKAL